MYKDIAIVRQKSPIKITQLTSKTNTPTDRPRLKYYKLNDGTVLFNREDGNSVIGYRQTGHILQNENQCEEMGWEQAAKHSYKEYLNSCGSPNYIIYWTQQTNHLIKTQKFQFLRMQSKPIRQIFVHFDLDTPFMLILHQNGKYLYLFIEQKTTLPKGLKSAFYKFAMKMTNQVLFLMIDILLHFPHLVQNSVFNLHDQLNKLPTAIMDQHLSQRRKGRGYKLPLDIPFKKVDFQLAESKQWQYNARMTSINKTSQYSAHNK